MTGQGVSVEVKRNDQVSAQLAPEFVFQETSDYPNFSGSELPFIAIHVRFAYSLRLSDQVFVILLPVRLHFHSPQRHEYTNASPRKIFR